MRKLPGNLKSPAKLTKSRIEKRLLAFSRKFQRLFPSTPGKAKVFPHDSQASQRKPYTPFESTTRKCRIYNLRSWFLKHKVEVSDWEEVIVETTGYCLIFRQRTEEEAKYRQQPQSAKTEKQTEDASKKLTQARPRSVKKVAMEGSERLSRQVWERKRIMLAPRNRYEGVPASLRTLLKIVHGGRCQICGFTSLKCDDKPYFEVHRVDPEAEHQPQNLLVLCPNCHAQMEHANVGVERNEQGWIVAVTVNGEKRPVHQAIAPTTLHSLPPVLLPFLSLLTLSIATKISQGAAL